MKNLCGPAAVRNTRAANRHRENPGRRCELRSEPEDLPADARVTEDYKRSDRNLFPAALLREEFF